MAGVLHHARRTALDKPIESAEGSGRPAPRVGDESERDLLPDPEAHGAPIREIRGWREYGSDRYDNGRGRHDRCVDHRARTLSHCPGLSISVRIVPDPVNVPASHKILDFLS